MAAVNYSNNLVYAVLYLIGALSFVSAFHTWRNIASLEIEHVRVKRGFRGRGDSRWISILRNHRGKRRELQSLPSSGSIAEKESRCVRGKGTWSMEAGDARR